MRKAVDRLTLSWANMRATQIHEDFQNEMSKIGPRPVDQARIGKDNGGTPLNVEGGKVRGINKDKKYSIKKM